MTEKYTPEKVAEARAKLAQHAMRRDLGAMPKHIHTVLDALTAVSAERDAAQRKARMIPKRLRADRDRLHKAITEALDLTRPGASVPLGVSEVRHIDRLMATTHGILRAALDKQDGADDGA
jgi:hypothetical protein